MKRNEFIRLNLKAAAACAIAPSLVSFNKDDFDLKFKQLAGLSFSHLTSTKTLEKQTYLAFLKMKNAALKDQINIQIVSGFRSFERQKAIFERKFRNNKKEGLNTEDNFNKIITYSTIPGTSRHHWGTDMDIIDANQPQPKGSLLNPDNYHGIGNYCTLKEWMEANANRFGFYLVYTQNYHRKGFNYEPWHYSYKPISQSFLELQNSEKFISRWAKLKFEGKDLMSDDFIRKYFKDHINDINPKLKA
ncbi:MAG: M15 family metallopeptidase [Psychroflexus halocasei]|uniref:M15 family metallopeptidase n=1 Tax=Psychroflexus sp. S27 TaxID=1982757 RepID=UPI000C2B03B9|nr:M15 family metallopeptidase [Psychroflexus sp. S27]MDN6281174.1 M15 family metallopeptidase [Psychroflexus sp.]MDN6310790.1 M15 family metallopeptidase [Psychroflexus sp.]PJX23257.1 hypothetical protein CAP47_06000 [Psychroflexus sp. S27]